MIYIHIPFCRSFCTYCGFYSELLHGRESLCEQFSDALSREIRERREDIPSHLNTLYIGGGTPSVLPSSVLDRAVKELGGCFDEFTVEVNPEDITEDYARTLVGMGVNRVSMGVQSFDDGILKWMNRRHNARKAVEAFGMLRAAGVSNISIDLIFGLPQLCGSGLWEDSVTKAISLQAEHISAYQLSVEEGSALEKLVARGRFTEAGDEACRWQYDYLCSALAAAGYCHYEVSNFALPGFEALHNSGYWKHIPYIGFGPGAHSFLNVDGEWIRSWNNPDLKAYIEGPQRGGETLNSSQLEMERIMLALRTSSGTALKPSATRDRLIREGCLSVLSTLGAGSLLCRIPEDRFFVSDDIIRELCVF